MSAHLFGFGKGPFREDPCPDEPMDYDTPEPLICDFCQEREVRAVEGGAALCRPCAHAYRLGVIDGAEEVVS